MPKLRPWGPGVEGKGFVLRPDLQVVTWAIDGQQGPHHADAAQALELEWKELAAHLTIDREGTVTRNWHDVDGADAIEGAVRAAGLKPKDPIWF